MGSGSSITPWEDAISRLAGDADATFLCPDCGKHNLILEDLNPRVRRVRCPGCGAQMGFHRGFIRGAIKPEKPALLAARHMIEEHGLEAAKKMADEAERSYLEAWDEEPAHFASEVAEAIRIIEGEEIKFRPWPAADTARGMVDEYGVDLAKTMTQRGESECRERGDEEGAQAWGHVAAAIRAIEDGVLK